MTGMPQAATVLVIDDNVTLARAFAQVLARAGWHVRTAHTAEDGLHLARVQLPDVIILDVRMPFVNGIGFLYRLRALPGLENTPVMVVTGASLDDEARADLHDLRAVVRFKPLGATELLAEARLLLGGRRQNGCGPPAE